MVVLVILFARSLSTVTNLFLLTQFEKKSHLFFGWLRLVSVVSDPALQDINSIQIQADNDLLNMVEQINHDIHLANLAKIIKHYPLKPAIQIDIPILSLQK